MSRPKKERYICPDLDVKCFGPIGSSKDTEIVEIFCDELEAIKLVNLEDMSMEKWGQKMWISAATFNRILKSAYKKISDALINWKNLAVIKK